MGDVSERTVGLNRRLNNQVNTIAAATQALSSMTNLEAIELGNEPNCKSLQTTTKLLKPPLLTIESLHQL